MGMDDNNYIEKLEEDYESLRNSLNSAIMRIRELEAERANFYMKYRMECDKDTKRLEVELAVARGTINEYASYFTAERAISDKLENALAHYATDETAEGWTAITALAEVAAMRKNEN